MGDTDLRAGRLGAKRRTTFPSFGYVLGILVIALALAIGMLSPTGLPSALNQIAAKSWPTTPGTITRSEVIETGTFDDMTYRSDVHARYQVNGKKFTLTEIYFGQAKFESNDTSEAVKQHARYSVDKQVVVYFNPAKNDQAVLTTDIHGSSFVMLAISSALILLGSFLLYWSCKETLSWIQQRRATQ